MTDLYQVAVAFATSRAHVLTHVVSDLMALVRSVSAVPGDIIECGSYRGGTAMAMALADNNKQVYAFDTFTGMPAVTAEDQHKPGDFAVDFAEVAAATKPFANLSLVKGEFTTTFPQFLGSRSSGYTISVLFLDCDLYESYKLALQTWWSRINPGGICVMDDYGVTDCQGATKAVEEFFAPSQIELKEHLYVVTK